MRVGAVLALSALGKGCVTAAGYYLLVFQHLQSIFN